jgi:hypothetical protein
MTETKTNIDTIKELYAQVDKKTQFIIYCAEQLGKAPNTLRHHWFGQFWSIPEDHQEEVIQTLNDTLKNQ